MSRKKQSTLDWEEKFLKRISTVHKRNLKKVVSRILKKITTAKYSIDSRSKKYNVSSNVSIEELRELVYKAYGQKCKYCDKTITVANFVFDHIHPISKQGTSDAENLQVICKTSNVMKGSLTESNFKILLDWLNTLDDELKKDISIRLSRGLH